MKKYRGMTKLEIVEIQSGKKEVERDAEEPFFGVYSNEELTDSIQSHSRRLTHVEKIIESLINGRD